jgi:polar amino acid transport system substrate-binding protein
MTLIGIRQSYAENLLILTEEWNPISFSRNGQADGLSVEIVREILYRLNSADEIQVVPWARGWKTLMENPNVVLFTMTRTAEREKLFTMIGPVAVGTTNFFAKKGSGLIIEKLEDAKKMRAIGVYRSAVEEQLLIKAGFANLDATTLPLSSAKKLMLNRIDLWCNANLTAGKILEDAGYSINNVENVFTLQENHLYIAFSRGTAAAVVDKWQSALAEIKNDGTFARIYHKWLPIDTPPPTTERIGILQ